MLTFNTVVLFFIGFFILVRGAEILVKGAISVASLFNVSRWFIGIAIVSVGTSVPELSVSLASVFNERNLALGTIVGSNIFTTLFILGFIALFYPIVMKETWVRRDFLFGIFAVTMAGAALILPLLGDPTYQGITRPEGAVLLGGLIFWIWNIYMEQKVIDKDIYDYEIFSLFTSFLMIGAGILGVFLGGQWVVEGGAAFARFAGVSEHLIALTVISVGTSVPELTVSFVALARRSVGIAVGNIVGSNIFTFLGVLGITALAHPFEVVQNVRVDLFASLLVAATLYVAMFVGKRNSLTRVEGIIFILLYTVYLTFIIMRG